MFQAVQLSHSGTVSEGCDVKHCVSTKRRSNDRCFRGVVGPKTQSRSWRRWRCSTREEKAVSICGLNVRADFMLNSCVLPQLALAQCLQAGCTAFGRRIPEIRGAQMVTVVCLSDDTCAERQHTYMPLSPYSRDRGFIWEVLWPTTTVHLPNALGMRWPIS